MQLSRQSRDKYKDTLPRYTRVHTTHYVVLILYDFSNVRLANVTNNLGTEFKRKDMERLKKEVDIKAETEEKSVPAFSILFLEETATVLSEWNNRQGRTLTDAMTDTLCQSPQTTFLVRRQLTKLPVKNTIYGLYHYN